LLEYRVGLKANSVLELFSCTTVASLLLIMCVMIVSLQDQNSRRLCWRCGIPCVGWCQLHHRWDNCDCWRHAVPAL